MPLKHCFEHGTSPIYQQKDVLLALMSFQTRRPRPPKNLGLFCSVLKGCTFKFTVLNSSVAFLQNLIDGMST